MSASPAPRRGQIWRVWTPGQPEDPHQPRPALIISENRRNYTTDDVTVIPAFSEGALGPTRVRLPKGEGGIEHDSILFCEEVTTIDKSFLVGFAPLGGAVSEEVLDRAILAVRRALGEVIPGFQPVPGEATAAPGHL